MKSSQKRVFCVWDFPEVGYFKCQILCSVVLYLLTHNVVINIIVVFNLVLIVRLLERYLVKSRRDRLCHWGLVCVDKFD